MKAQINGIDFLKSQLSELDDDPSLPWNNYPCLEWPRARTMDGYGKFKFRSSTVYAHRTAYQMAYGGTLDGFVICHHCDNPPCFRPSHLFAGTQRDNLADCIRKGRNNRGERGGNARLTECQVRAIRIDCLVGMSHSAIATKFGVTRRYVGNIVNYQRWRHVI